MEVLFDWIARYTCCLMCRDGRCQRVSVGPTSKKITRIHLMNRRFDLLKKASSVHGLASALDYSPNGLTYILFVIDDSNKYTEFTIRKRSGGIREINAPVPELRRLQRTLAKVLENCIDDIDEAHDVVNTLSHGFRAGHSVLTNAVRHRRSRYVFNIDLSDFFGTINFGRVLGFFQKNKDFQLHPKVARLIAQIACHSKNLPDGQRRTFLPQGSPCSPVISNLIAHILDMRMVQIAARLGCHYSRYADDLTFSSNHLNFPSALAQRINGTTQWVASRNLVREIRRCGFELNISKTRMQYKEFRQDVTGIIVNTKLNVRTEYARRARAMVHSLVTVGEFCFRWKERDDKGQWVEKEEKGKEDKLRGVLSHIDAVRHYEKLRVAQAGTKNSEDDWLPRVEFKKMDAHARVYRQFLLFTQFYRPLSPLVICEGKTDNVYLRCALRQIGVNFPEFFEQEGNNDPKLKLKFFNYSKTSDRLLHLRGGVGDMKSFIANYGNGYSTFNHKGKRQPVILIVDNDDAAREIFSTIKKLTNSAIAIDGCAQFYHVKDNLYVVALPKLAGVNTTIEDFFPKEVLEMELGGKKFSREDNFGPGQYGKHLFAEQVVMRHQAKIDFSSFTSIFRRISDAIAAHEAKVA